MRALKKVILSGAAAVAIVGAGAASANAAPQSSAGVRPQCCNEWHWQYTRAYNQGVSGWGACAIDGTNFVKNSLGAATKYECLQNGGPYYAPIIDLYLWTTVWR